ncbi:MAG: flippase [Candidatus Blackburnbacteria bacterium]|nr:flippase [Candidatus Blackburnbacteria bacterium]
MFRRVALNTIVQGAGRAAVLLFSLITTGILTRSMGVDGYGAYAFVTAFVLLFGSVGDWGTNIIAVREASQKKDLQPAVFGNATLFRLALSFIGLLLLNLAVRINPAWDKFVEPTTIASFVLLALSLKTSVGIIFQTLLRYEFSVIVEIFSSLAFLGLVLFMISGGLSGVMLSWLFATVLASLVGLFFARRLSPISWTPNIKIIKRLFWEAAPAGALFLFFNLYNRVDTVILHYFQGEEAVGIYGLAYKVHDNLVLGAAFLMNAMFPLFSAGIIKAGKKADLKKYYQKAFDLLFGGGLIIFFLFFAAAPFIIKLLGGDQFLLSIGTLRLLLFATFIAYFNHLTGYSLIAFGRQKTSMLIALAALVFNIIANVLLIPLYSYTAAAAVTVATEGLVLLLSTLAVRGATGIFPSVFSPPKTWLSLARGKVNIF